MRFRVLLALVMLLAATPVLAQKVYIDYDKEHDFETIETFAWSATEDTSLAKSDPLLHSRIVNAIEHHLGAGEVREASGGESPSIYITYHASSKEELSFNTTSFGYGYPGGWAYGGYGYGGYHGYGWGGSMGSSTSTVSTYEVGSLVVDAWDADAKELVWRGTAGGIMVTENANKMGKRIDKALQKIVKKSHQTFDKAKKQKG